MIVAVDFDGTLCKHMYPYIGQQDQHHKNLMEQLIKFRQNDQNKLILWTCRDGKMLQEAVQWCKNRGLQFDAINQNVKQHQNLNRHYSVKVIADFYIDDKAQSFANTIDKESTVRYFKKFINKHFIAPNKQKE